MQQFALAMMMSREEEEQRQQNLALEASADDFLNDDLDHLQLEEDEMDDGNDDISDVISRASSYGLGSSRASTSQLRTNDWQVQSSGRNDSLPTSPYIRATLSPTFGPQSYSRLQLSPRLNPHLFESPRRTSPAADLNEVSEWPLPSPAGSAASATVPDTLGTSPKPQSPSPIGSLGNTWSAVAGAGTKGLARSPARTEGGVSPSLLTARLRAGQPKNDTPPSQELAEEEMDEELKFVLELSRAEEESRQAAKRLGL